MNSDKTSGKYFLTLKSMIALIRLKQEDALSPILFNLALEYAVREIQRETTGIEINQQKIQILGFVDDLKIVGNTRYDTKKAMKVLEK